MDNQTWFDATLVKRFNDCNREVTIHRPNVSTLLSSAFIRVETLRQGWKPVMKALDRSVETLGP